MKLTFTIYLIACAAIQCANSDSLDGTNTPYHRDRDLGRKGGRDRGGHRQGGRGEDRPGFGGSGGRNITVWCEDINCDTVTDSDLAECWFDSTSNDSNSTSADDAGGTSRRLGRTLHRGRGGRGRGDKWANFTAEEKEEAKLKRRACKCCNDDE